MIIKIKNTVVVFDLDDTLYNELDYLKSAYRHISKILTKKDGWEFLYAQMFSLYRNKKDVFSFLCNTFKVEKEFLLNEYRNHIPDIKPFDRVINLLKEIKKKNGKIAIITDGREITQTNKINKLGLKKFLDLIVISEVVGTEKPNENNYKIIESHFPNYNYIYIGDNIKKDFITPNIRKWKTVGLIDNGLNIHNDDSFFISEKPFLPNYFINSYNEIILTDN
ncbi:HAD family hydrolase [Thalassobellus sediminis]|uniref:HAD family hydrolase n=1 Tax=Thalassobellus sediminis TaxID=3367753 RepID=UPI00379FC6B5